MSITLTSAMQHTVLSEIQYRMCLHPVSITLGHLINSPPEYNSDITRTILTHLDIISALAFSQISKNIHKKTQQMFESRYRQIALKYVQIGTSYNEYVKKSGWSDYIISTLEIVGIVMTVVAGVKAGIHASAIPRDAPQQTTTDGQGKTQQATYTDHPEVQNMRTWGAVSGVLGGATVMGIVSHGIYVGLQNVDLDLFFSLAEKDLLGEETTSLGLRILSPNFHYWKLKEMKRRLSTNPHNWHRHSELKNNICPLSGDFMLFPVRDSCGKHGGHLIDYRSLRAYQFDPNTQDPLECPVSLTKPNKGFARIRFDKEKFDWIQSRILDLTPANFPN